MQTVEGSLGGAWYARLPGWLMVFPAVILLEYGQDSEVRSVSLGLVLISALVQHVVAGIVFFSVGRLGHLRWDVIPLPLGIFGWLASAVARGLTGGLFAAAAIGVPPDYRDRIITWVMIVAATQPLITYVLAQVDHRRALLGQLNTAVTSLRVARKEARRTTATTRGRLVSTVRDAVDPLMWEVRASLGSLSADTDPAFLTKIGEQLQAITDDIDWLLSDEHALDDIDNGEGAGEPREQLIAALEFAPSHYVLSVLLPPVVVVTRLVPESWRSDGVGGLEEIAAAALASGAVLGALFGLYSWLRKISQRVRLFALRLGFVFAGLAASTAAFLTILAIHGREDDTLLYILPITVAIASALVMGALGISVANRNLTATLEDVRRDVERLHRNAALRDRRVSGQVATLLHGPVMGRLSACVMAINLWPETSAGRSGNGPSLVASRVLGHLEAAASDLESLGRL
jgi:hypothetical protein